jgi:hypothetical protein
MKNPKHPWVRVLCVLLTLCVLIGALWAAGRVVQPKYLTASLEGSLTAEYYADVAEVSHDVLFVGDCEVYESFIPAVLWEQYGISSYVRGSAQQLVWQSYYLLEDALQYETPQVVVFNVLALKYGEPQSESYNRMTLDGMAWSLTKVNAIRASLTEEESFLSYLLPVLRFHSRWNQLTAEDWQYAFGAKPAVSDSGYLMQTGIQPADIEGDSSLHETLTDPSLPASAMAWLDRMADLCEEKGIALVLVKAPTNSWIYWWYDEWEQQIQDYAAQRGLSYYNLIPDGEAMGLDWSKDTYDGGLHLNVTGAEKLSVWFGRILSQELQVPDRRAEASYALVWEERVSAFYGRLSAAASEEAGKESESSQ